MHSLGYEMGYALNKSVLLNPLDYIFHQSQKVFISNPEFLYRMSIIPYIFKYGLITL